MRHPVIARFVLTALLGGAVAAGDGAPPVLLPLKAGEGLHILGDSVTSGSNQPFGFTSLVRRAWEEQRPNEAVRFGATGYWGSPSEALREAVPTLLKANPKPAIVLIYFGLNDSKDQSVASQEAFDANLRTAVTALRGAGIATALCTPTVWRSLQQTIPFAAVTRRVAGETGSVLIDLHAAFDRYLRSVATFKPGEVAHVYGMPTTLDPTCDGVHLGAVGNRLIACEIAQALGLKPVWRRHAVVVTLGNVDRNIGYPPTGKATIIVEPKKEFYELGEKLTLRVEPAEGQVFHGWRGSVEGATPTVTYTVDGSAFIQAVVEAPGGGRGKRK